MWTRHVLGLNTTVLKLLCVLYGLHAKRPSRDASEAERAGGPPRADETGTRVVGLERPSRAHPARAPWPGRRSRWRTTPRCHNCGAGEQHRPTTRQRAGAGHARTGTAAWNAILGAVTPPGRRTALPHAAPRTHAPLLRKNQYSGIERSVRRRDASACAVGACLDPPAATMP